MSNLNLTKYNIFQINELGIIKPSLIDQNDFSKYPRMTNGIRHTFKSANCKISILAIDFFQLSKSDKDHINKLKQNEFQKIYSDKINENAGKIASKLDPENTYLIVGICYFIIDKMTMSLDEINNLLK
jgi:hypothetical protein